MFVATKEVYHIVLTKLLESWPFVKTCLRLKAEKNQFNVACTYLYSFIEVYHTSLVCKVFLHNTNFYYALISLTKILLHINGYFTREVWISTLEIMLYLYSQKRLTMMWSKVVPIMLIEYHIYKVWNKHEGRVPIQLNTWLFAWWYGMVLMHPINT